jgi:hypothetical protein
MKENKNKNKGQYAEVILFIDGSDPHRYYGSSWCSLCKANLKYDYKGNKCPKCGASFFKIIEDIKV